jgi:hypothetical protein
MGPLAWFSHVLTSCVAADRAPHWHWGMTSYASFGAAVFMILYVYWGLHSRTANLTDFQQLLDPVRWHLSARSPPVLCLVCLF